MLDATRMPDAAQFGLLLPQEVEAEDDDLSQVRTLDSSPRVLNPIP